MDTTEDTMNTYTVTLTAAQGGRHPHAFRGIEAATAQDAIVAAYRERHGDHVTVTTRDVHARGNDISDTQFSVFGTAGAVTFADVERTDDTVQARKVWRCAGGSGSGLAFRGDHGFVEVFRDDVASTREAGTELFRITV